MSADIDFRNAQMFLDDEIVEQAVRAQRVVHQPHKHFANPLYTVGAPWEGNGVVYLAGVYRDPTDAVWKAWYTTLNPPGYPEIIYAVCMITSDDGIHWERPELDVFPGHNGESTNIVLDMGRVGGTGAATILHEPEREDTPWCMIISSCEEGTWDYKGYVLHSSDGAHWVWDKPLPFGVEHRMNDRCTAFRGPDAEFPYVLLSRGSEDSKTWDLVRSVHRVAINSESADGELHRILTPDLEDDNAGQIYHAHAFAYEGIYVGLFQWYWETDDPYGEMELMTSRDSVRWNRLRPRQAFLPRSPGGAASGAFDCQITDTALSPPARTSQGQMETLWFYYWGGPAMHGNRHLTFGRGIGLAQLRVDGFCSLRAKRFPGTVVTKPLVWPGGRLLINASVLGGGGNGGIRVEVLSEDLMPVGGLTLADADLVSGDGCRLEATWNKRADVIADMKDKRIRLKFHLDNVDFYSFRADNGGAR